MKIEIRTATEQNIQIIANYQIEMAMETESLQLDADIVLKGVTTIFQNPELGQYYIALSKNTPIASLLTTYEWSDWRNARVLWIQSVFVRKEYRKKGVFAALYQHIKEIALEDKNIGGIRLYVDKTNIAAQETYKKVGMNGEHYQLFEWMING